MLTQLDELEQVRKQIEYHREELAKLRERRDKIQRVLYSNTTGERRGPDEFYVVSAEVRPYVESWVARYNRQYGGGGVRTLAMRAGLNTRSVRKVKNGGGNTYGEMISYSTLRRILEGINLEYILDEFTLYRRSRDNGFVKMA
jgi:hypothetical protein